MKSLLALLIAFSAPSPAAAFGRNRLEQTVLREVVYVESPTDTDSDGRPDQIYVSIERPLVEHKLSTIYAISPYALGGNKVEMHGVDMDLLPQDEKLNKFFSSSYKKNLGQRKSDPIFEEGPNSDVPKYAQIKAHSLGTGKSTGCPTVGDMAETLAAKSVIDWLNGRARAFYEDGKEARADWANGNVGMTGISYNGTLPIMVATTGVEGLKAIVPIASISNWYDYYRANGLVVNPGGYIGEDADILGYYIVRKGSCKNELSQLTQQMGRENGDFNLFWQKRDYLPGAHKIKAATFIIHGQADWNVKQKHAIQLWEALEGVAPRRMFLHRGGHASTTAHDVPKKIQAWFDHFLEGEDNGITSGPQVEVELPDGSLMAQSEWPNEKTEITRFYFSPRESLSAAFPNEESLTITDMGKTQKLEGLVEHPNRPHKGRLAFLTAPLEKAALLSGTARVSLSLSVLNRKAANITVAVVEYDRNGQGKIITRGWADPQNHHDHVEGELLIPGQSYKLSFELEPKQYQLQEGSRLGVIITSTDYEYTLRPKEGTLIQVNLGADSFIELRI